LLRWDTLTEIPIDWPGSVVTIGVFDGVHRGHAAILDRAVLAGREIELPVVALTFEPHPAGVVRPGSEPLTISTLEHRVSLLGAAGAAAVCVLAFTIELSRLSPEQFVERVLVDALGTRRVVVGANFRFGARAAGDVGVLRELGEQFGFSVDAVKLVGGAGKWSSTVVRNALAAGDVAAAAEVLGRFPRLEGLVVPGDRRGRDLGYPTANLAVPAGLAVAADGVYAGWLVRHPDTPAEERWPAAVSIGTNPTFGDLGRRVEAYVLDSDFDLYGELVALDLVAWVRDQRKFDSVEELVVAMAVDVAQVRSELA
jgi:riboflavin kinase/FMN adenylyltransferase